MFKVLNTRGCLNATVWRLQTRAGKWMQALENAGLYHQGDREGRHTPIDRGGHG